MSRNKVWIAIALLQVPLSHVSGQTCPLDDSKLTILDHTTASRDRSNFDIRFDGCDQVFGPSGSDGVVSYGPCGTFSITPTAFSRNSFTVGWTLRNASFAAARPQVIAAVAQSSPCQSFSFLSGGGATILAALISGLFGTVITYYLQKRKSGHDRKLQDLSKQEEENRARQYLELDRERDLFRSAHQLVGRCLNAGQSLIAIATPEFQSETPGPRQAQAKEELRAAFDATEAFWNAERYSIRLLIKLDRPNQDHVQQIWSEIDAAIASYFEICKQIYNEYRVSQTLVTSQQKAAVKNDYVLRTEVALNNLEAEIVAARQSSDRGIGSSAFVDSVR
jgi:hypothetical protein